MRLCRSRVVGAGANSANPASPRRSPQQPPVIVRELLRRARRRRQDAAEQLQRGVAPLAAAWRRIVEQPRELVCRATVDEQRGARPQRGAPRGAPLG